MAHCPPNFGKLVLPHMAIAGYFRNRVYIGNEINLFIFIGIIYNHYFIVPFRDKIYDQSSKLTVISCSFSRCQCDLLATSEGPIRKQEAKMRTD